MTSFVAGYAGVGGLMNSMVTRAIIVISILSLVGLAFTYPTNTVRADTGKIYLISAEGCCEDGTDNDGDGDTDYQDAINCRLVPPNWAQELQLYLKTHSIGKCARITLF